MFYVLFTCIGPVQVLFIRVFGRTHIHYYHRDSVGGTIPYPMLRYSVDEHATVESSMDLNSTSNRSSGEVILMALAMVVIYCYHNISQPLQ